MTQEKKTSLVDLHREHSDRPLAKLPQSKVTLVKRPPECVVVDIDVLCGTESVQLQARCVLTEDCTAIRTIDIDTHNSVGEWLDVPINAIHRELAVVEAHVRAIVESDLFRAGHVDEYYVGLPRAEECIDVEDRDCQWLMEFTPHDLALRFLYQLDDQERNTGINQLLALVSEHMSTSRSNVLDSYKIASIPFSRLYEGNSWIEEHIDYLTVFSSTEEPRTSVRG